MANINNMEMSKVIFANNNIAINKSFFGLKTSVSYIPTQSPVEAKQYEFSQETGRKIAGIMSASDDELKELVSKVGKIDKSDMGNMRVDICVSRDRQFIALHLFQYEGFSYSPITEPRIIEGETAKAVASLLLD
ncbi:MAG: hypothetical protein SOZ80_02765 [Prevotella sp.]|uniref:hypothetical protein n=1 Tax=Prevotella sp. TaxID=59823 RepID=UPI002A2EF0E2|nr:hypothetical protein [Prevotella sp.]MDD7318309.1 hypothetical protein [Prevotellaceae bacterium]MDY4019687.1 hypothetical protein [Prevotella sp.]